jgi:hypothetical protein
MDPLSLTGSIVGLLHTVAKLSVTLNSIKSSIGDAPRWANSVLAEVDGFRRQLEALQALITKLSSVKKSRTALIQLDYIIVPLTECVLTFSELESIVAALPVFTSSNFSLSDRVKWARKGDKVSRIIEKLHRDKTSLILILNIMQWYGILRNDHYYLLYGLTIKQRVRP